MIPLTDNPVERIDDDAFGFVPYVRELHTAVLAAEPLPLTVGIFGSWGTGKSSFLGMWRDLLMSTPDSHTVWFNPWKYDRKVEVWAALLHTILAELKEKEGLREQAAKLARAATWLSLRAGLGQAASLATAGVIGREDVGKLIDAFSDEDGRQYGQVNAFEQEFAAAVKRFVGPTGRLVVFVDDLDRCTPESAVTVLESLKLFLGQARCVFVLALDIDVLAAVATNKFGQALTGAPDDAVSGMNYLEKIVQLPFFLPEIGFPSLRTALTPYVGDLGDAEPFWELVRIGLGNNPRRVKRYINVLNLAIAALGRAYETDPDRLGWVKLQLAELLIIRSRHRAFFRTIVQYPDAWMTLEKAAEDMTLRRGDRDLFIARLPHYLQEYAKDPELLRLMDTRPGGPHNHPPAPDGQGVLRMISTLQMLGQIPADADISADVGTGTGTGAPPSPQAPPA